MPTFAAQAVEGNFVYYNRRPDGQHKQDCVCRAISTATGIDYETVDRLLEKNAKENECEKLCVCCYHSLLDGTFGYPRHYCHNNETVEEIAQAHPNDNLIIRIQEHLTCSINGQVLDFWDCSGKAVDCFWIVK